jgi:hypothetical protein
MEVAAIGRLSPPKSDYRLVGKSCSDSATKRRIGQHNT